MNDQKRNIKILKKKLAILHKQVLELEKREIKFKHLHQALLVSELKYRTLIEQSGQGILIVQPLPLRILFANPAIVDILGYTPDDLASFSASRLIKLLHPDERQGVPGRLRQVMSGKSGFQRQLRIIRKDGKVRWLDVFGRRVDHLGNLSLQLAVVDITERKGAYETLRLSEEKYKTLTEHINIGVYRNTPGPRGKFLEVNSTFCKMFGYKSKGEVSNIWVSTLYQNPEDRRQFNNKMLKYGFVSNQELQLKKRDGAPFIGLVSAVAVKNENGKVKFYDGIVEDITDWKSYQYEVHQGLNKMQRILEETVDALASTLGKRDPYTGGHQQRVTNLACAIAEDMGLSRDVIKGIRVAGLLHDIGKIAIPAEILSKPSRLTVAEFNIVKDHPQIGYEILKSVEFPWPIAEIVLQHHELLDGSGYPRGLRDSRILLEAKIMVVADVVEAMCSHRPYRPAHSLKTSLSEIAKYRGTLYDPEVVDTCLKLFHKKKFQFLPNH